MTPTTSNPWALALALMAFLGVAYALVKDLPDDPAPDWEAQVQAQRDARAERAAAELCWRATGGTPAWTADGYLVCQRGEQVVWIASRDAAQRMGAGKP